MGFQSKKPHPGGRPLMFKTVQELEDKINQYFKECDENIQDVITKGGHLVKDVNVPLIPSIAGLAYWLGVGRETIYNYSEKDKFVDTITRARDRIVSEIEKKMVNVDGNISGTIFVAKNYGYKDTVEQNTTIRFDEEIKKELGNMFENTKVSKKA